MRRALAAIMALLMVLLSLACASAETPPSFVLYDEQEEADTAAPEAIREQKTTVTQTEKPSEEEAPEQEETEPGEEDESQARLAQLQTDRASRAPKEALAVSGRRAVGREDVARAAAARRAVPNARV